MAVPIIPILGINKKFKMMLTIAPRPVRVKVSLLKPSAIRNWPLATPKNTNRLPQTCTANTGAAATY